jgi:hypothetical protein
MISYAEKKEEMGFQDEFLKKTQILIIITKEIEMTMKRFEKIKKKRRKIEDFKVYKLTKGDGPSFYQLSP